MKRTAPWPPEFVDLLNAWQACGWTHPYTCPNRDAGHPRTDWSGLVATPDGWICRECDYRQDWAHDMSELPPNPWDVIADYPYPRPEGA